MSKLLKSIANAKQIMNIPVNDLTTMTVAYNPKIYTDTRTIDGKTYTFRYIQPSFAAISSFDLENMIAFQSVSDGSASYDTLFRFNFGNKYLITATGHGYNLVSTMVSTNLANNEYNVDIYNRYPMYNLRIFNSGNDWISWATYTYGDTTFVGWFAIGIYSSGYATNFTGISIDDLMKYTGGDFDYIEISETYGPYSSGGGYSGGGFDDSSDIIAIPDVPSLSVSQMGFVNVYRPSEYSLAGMVDELFPNIDVPDLPTGDDIAGIITALNSLVDMVANGIIQFGNHNLLDYVLSAHIIPVSPSVGSSTSIKVGYKTLNVSAPKVSSDYVDFSCGTLNIKEYYSNYIDYCGTKAQLYLPFVGFVPLKPEHFLNGAITVKYRFNIIDGSFCAWVLSTSSKSNLTTSVIGSYSGNCCVHIPISAVNYSSIISGMVGGVSNMINAFSASSPTTAAKDVVSGALDVANTKPTVAMSNGYNATSSYTGIRYPYILIERPVASFSKSYPSENGLPLNVTKKLSDISGYTIISELHTESLTCSDKEKAMIQEAFVKGVII